MSSAGSPQHQAHMKHWVWLCSFSVSCPQASFTDWRSSGPSSNTPKPRPWRSTPSCRSAWASSNVWRTSESMWVENCLNLKSTFGIYLKHISNNKIVLQTLLTEWKLRVTFIENIIDVFTGAQIEELDLIMWKRVKIVLSFVKVVLE